MTRTGKGIDFWRGVSLGINITLRQNSLKKIALNGYPIQLSDLETCYWRL